MMATLHRVLAVTVLQSASASVTAAMSSPSAARRPFCSGARSATVRRSADTHGVVVGDDGELREQRIVRVRLDRVRAPVIANLTAETNLVVPLLGPDMLHNTLVVIQVAQDCLQTMSVDSG